MQRIETELRGLGLLLNGSASWIGRMSGIRMSAFSLLSEARRFEDDLPPRPGSDLTSPPTGTLSPTGVIQRHVLLRWSSFTG